MNEARPFRSIGMAPAPAMGVQLVPPSLETSSPATGAAWPSALTFNNSIPDRIACEDVRDSSDNEIAPWLEAMPLYSAIVARVFELPPLQRCCSSSEPSRH